MGTNELFAFFDLGKVLVDFELQSAIDQLAALASRPAELVRQIAFDSGLEDRFETGLLDETQYCAEINRLLETELSQPEILEAVSSIFTLNEPILEALQYLKSKGIPMAVLSNTCSAHWNWIAQQNWSIPGDWFEFAVLSYEVGSMKPDPGIYAASEAGADRTGANLFFTDDREENVVAATERGWTTHLFRSTDALMPVLREWVEQAEA